MRRALALSILLAGVVLLPAPASAQLGVQDIISHANQLRAYRAQMIQLEMQIQELKFLSTQMFSRQFLGYYLRDQIVSCPWSKEYTTTLDGVMGNLGSRVAYMNSTLRTLENGCIIDVSDSIKAQRMAQAKLDKANARALEAIGYASRDLRQFDQEIGAAIVWAGDTSEEGRTTTAQLQKTVVNTMLTAAIARRQLVTQDAMLEAVSTANHVTRDQIVERLNSEYQRNANWNQIMGALR